AGRAPGAGSGRGPGAGRGGAAGTARRARAGAGRAARGPAVGCAAQFAVRARDETARRTLMQAVVARAVRAIGRDCASTGPRERGAFGANRLVGPFAELP